MDRSLAQTATYLGLGRQQLITQMRAKRLLNDRNLPAYPTRDRAYLIVKEGRWYHPELGLQYSQSTRVRQAGMPWLAEQLGIDLPPPPADHRDVA
ncbi:phage antirepressor YoqD-like protein [Pseudomonas sp. JUb42]|uniref:phage antirepressor KilAC domain-containing protein n=1 Tax=Pseudomonas sp. JUb42 TaxID=2940611 RepID=UPI00216A3909|nr:phage antirepressor KilAC domain-containing protein [Pseudomonas sp. JUb42]MCS3467421.1 phage antirepressor YoqD-like protein [Pseudomonas sp. JUb42]